MNQHLSEGYLRAALDGELSETELQHLNTCPTCQARREKIRLQIQPAAEGLSFLAASAQEPAPAAKKALKDFYQLKTTPKENFIFKKIFAYPIMKFGLAVVLILVFVLSVPSTRAMADQLLNLFRVQHVVIVPVDFTGIQRLTGNSTLGSQISNLISRSVSVDQKPGKLVNATDADQASQLAGFTVRLPQGMTTSHLSVRNTAAFSFKVDRTKAQTLLNEAGRSDLILPASVDGAEVSINIPASVSAAYGTCPVPGLEDNGLNLESGGSAGRNYPDCVLLVEITSPVVSAPANVDIAQLAQIGLELTGMSTDQATTFTKTIDWNSSLVVPIPKNAATYEQVTIDDVTGTLIQRPADDEPEYILLWIKNGIIYAISSLGTDSEHAIEMANSLP